jgi:hypothetical protein
VNQQSKKRKPGRPRLPKGEAKQNALPAVRLDLFDFRLIVAAAKATGKELSEWVRESLRTTAEEQMYQRTLHEAMRIVLSDRTEHSATTSELSEEIERRGLYVRKNGAPAKSATTLFTQMSDARCRSLVRAM